MKPVDLESLRSIFADKRSHIALALVKNLEIASDKSMVRVSVSILPDEREAVVMMTWESVGPEAGFFQLPNANDLVLVAFADGSEDLGFIIKRLTSKDDKLPEKALTGDTLLRALAGKKWIAHSDTKLEIIEDADENLVLGQVLKSCLSTVFAAIAAHKHIGNLGYYTAPPDNASVYTGQKASPIDDEAVLSDLAFTKKEV